MAAWRARGRFAQHDVSVEVAPVWVDADETRMEQILGNLIDNALKYTPAGGEVRARVARQGDAAGLEVSDTRPGIAPDHLERIFDLFVQGDRALDRAQGGLGIGLTLVRALAELHGGSVQATSDGPGKGSSFSIRLPCVRGPESHPGVATPLQRSARPR